MTLLGTNKAKQIASYNSFGIVYKGEFGYELIKISPNGVLEDVDNNRITSSSYSINEHFIMFSETGRATGIFVRDKAGNMLTNDDAVYVIQSKLKDYHTMVILNDTKVLLIDTILHKFILNYHGDKYDITNYGCFVHGYRLGMVEETPGIYKVGYTSNILNSRLELIVLEIDEKLTSPIIYIKPSEVNKKIIDMKQDRSDEK